MHRVPEIRHRDRGVLGDRPLRGGLKAACRSRPLADHHRVVRDDLHPHVDVLRRVHVRRECVEQQRVHALVLLPQIDHRRLARRGGRPERRILIGDQPRRKPATDRVQVVVSAAVDQRQRVPGVPHERRKAHRLGVVVGPELKAVVRVVADDPHVPLVHISRAIVADPDRVRRPHHRNDAGQIRVLRPQDRVGDVELAVALRRGVKHQIHPRVAGRGDVPDHLRLDLVERRPALPRQQQTVGRGIFTRAHERARRRRSRAAWKHPSRLRGRPGFLGFRERPGHGHTLGIFRPSNLSRRSTRQYQPKRRTEQQRTTHRHDCLQRPSPQTPSASRPHRSRRVTTFHSHVPPRLCPPRKDNLASAGHALQATR